MPEPADRHPELLGHPKLGAAGEHRVWSATRSAILVRAVPGALLQQHGRQLFPLEATTKLVVIIGITPTPVLLPGACNGDNGLRPVTTISQASLKSPAGT